MHQRKEFLNNLWRWKCGYPETNQTPKERGVSVSELAKTEWSSEFEQLMRNRLVFGAYRYGHMVHGGGNRKGKPMYDRTESIRERLGRFELTGNAEWLVDVANMALLIYEERQHPEFHFGHVDGDDKENYHDKIIK